MYMILQHIIITIILVACLGYATFCLIKSWKSWKSTQKSSDYKCAGCPFYEKCEKNKKKVVEKFGGIK